MAMNRCACAGHNDQTAIRGAREGGDGLLDLGRFAHVDRDYLNPERKGHSLDDGKLAGSPALGRIPKNRCAPHIWRDLFEQLQPFSAKAVFRSHEPGDVATWLSQAVDETGPHWIAGNWKYDRDGARRLQQRPYGRGAMRQDD